MALGYACLCQDDCNGYAYSNNSPWRQCYFMHNNYYMQGVDWGCKMIGQWFHFNPHALFIPHTGCGQCWTVDGNWKLTFPHCMFPVKNTVPNIHGLSFPDICPEELNGKKAFCSKHCAVAEEYGYPTDIRGFIKFQHTSTGMHPACCDYVDTKITFY